MSDTSSKSTINRRDAMARIAFTAAGAVVLGPAIYRVTEDTAVYVSVQHAKASPDGNIHNLTEQSLENNLRQKYQSESGPVMQRLSTILGAAIGFVSHHKADAAIKERSPDIY